MHDCSLGYPVRGSFRYRGDVPVDRLARTIPARSGMRARLHHLILDCPDPRALAGFYARLLDQPVTYDSDDFVVVADDRSSRPGVPAGRAPCRTWPTGGAAADAPRRRGGDRATAAR